MFDPCYCCCLRVFQNTIVSINLFSVTLCLRRSAKSAALSRRCWTKAKRADNLNIRPAFVGALCRELSRLAVCFCRASLSLIFCIRRHNDLSSTRAAPTGFSCSANVPRSLSPSERGFCRYKKVKPRMNEETRTCHITCGKPYIGHWYPHTAACTLVKRRSACEQLATDSADLMSK